ncbi:radical SAM protein [bacterium]|nr:radical SAM protein [candidate division CSSED10-310 bacterium]
MKLQVIEIFESIQGESSFVGLPFSFIRLAGCNLNCTWCDTRENLNRPCVEMRIKSIVQRVIDGGMKHVCITGGEPLLQTGCYPLMTELLNEGMTVTLETNGSIDISEVPPDVHRILDIKCPSSGMADRNHWNNLLLLQNNDEIKFIINDRGDFEFARQVYNRYLQQFTGPVFMSPVHDHLEARELASWILSDNIPFRVHLQIHKILNLP